MTPIILGVALVLAAMAVFAAGARMPHASGMPLYVVGALFAIVGAALLFVFLFASSILANFH